MESITLSETENSSVFSNTLNKEHFLKKIQEIKNVENPSESTMKLLIRGFNRLFKAFNVNEDYFVEIFCKWSDLTLEITTKWIANKQWKLYEQLVNFLTKYFAAFCVTDLTFIQQKVFKYWIKFLEQIPEDYRKNAVLKQSDVLIDLISSIFVNGHYLTQKLSLFIFLNYAKYFEDEYQDVLNKIFSNEQKKLKILLQNFNLVNFNVECRKFLNCFNMEVSEEMPVYSVIVNAITLGNIKIKPPMDNNKPSEFWVDFNSGMKSVSFSCSRTTFFNGNINDLITIEAEVSKIILNRNKNDLIIEVNKFLNLEEQIDIKELLHEVRLIRFKVNDDVFRLLRKSDVLKTINGNKKVNVIEGNSQDARITNYIENSNDKGNHEKNVSKPKDSEKTMNRTFVTSSVNPNNEKFEQILHSKDNGSQININLKDSENIFKKPNPVTNVLHLKKNKHTKPKKLNVQHFSNITENIQNKNLEKNFNMNIFDNDIDSNKNSVHKKQVKNKQIDIPDRNIQTRSATKAKNGLSLENQQKLKNNKNEEQNNKLNLSEKRDDKDLYKKYENTKIKRLPANKSLEENVIIEQNDVSQSYSIYTSKCSENEKLHLNNSLKLNKTKEKTMEKTNFKTDNSRIGDENKLIYSVLPSTEDDYKFRIIEVISNQGYIGAKNLLNDNMKKNNLNISSEEMDIVNSKLESVNSALERTSRRFFKTKLFEENCSRDEDIYEFKSETDGKDFKKSNKKKKQGGSIMSKKLKSNSKKDNNIKKTPTICQNNKLNSKQIIEFSDYDDENDGDVIISSLQLFQNKHEGKALTKKNNFQSNNNALTKSQNKLKRKSNYDNIKENKKIKKSRNSKSDQLTPESDRSVLCVVNNERSNEFDKIFDQLKNEERQSKAKTVGDKNEQVKNENETNSSFHKTHDVSQLFVEQETDILSKESLKIENISTVKTLNQLNESNEENNILQNNDCATTGNTSEYYAVSDESNQSKNLSDSLLNRFFEDLSSIPQNNIEETIFSNFNNFDNKNENNLSNNKDNNFEECVNLDNHENKEYSIIDETRDIEQKNKNIEENSEKDENKENSKLNKLEIIPMNKRSLNLEEDEESISKKRIKLSESNNNFQLDKKIGCIIMELNNTMEEIFQEFIKENSDFPDKIQTLKEIMAKYMIQYQNIMENELKLSIRKITTLTKNLNHENTLLLKSFTSLKICVDEMFTYIKSAKANTDMKKDQFNGQYEDMIKQISKKTKSIVTKKWSEYIKDIMKNLSHKLDDLSSLNLSLD